MTSSRSRATRDELESLAREIEANGGSCRHVVVDITDPKAVTTALDGVDAQVLVNNAGVGVTQAVHRADARRVDANGRHRTSTRCST